MNRTASISISALFHPVVVNMIGLIALVFLSPYLHMGLNPTARFFYIAFISVSAGVIPIMVVLIMKLLGRVKNIMLEIQDERNVPYLITACIYLFDYYFLSRIHTPALIRAYVLACACIVVAVVIINYAYKISIHAASLGALIAILANAAPFAMIDVRLLLAGAFVVAGITLSSRLFLLAHTNLQLLSGFLLGFVVMYLIL
jgi:hypothetical protein